MSPPGNSKSTTDVPTGTPAGTVSTVHEAPASTVRATVASGPPMNPIVPSRTPRALFDARGLVSADQVNRVSDLVRNWLADHEPDRETSGSETRVWSEAAESTVRFTTGLTDEAVSPLLTHLVNAGETIVQFRDVPSDLEDAFLSVAKDHDGVSQQDEIAVGAEA